MSIVRLQCLLAAEAEEAIARVWRVLEGQRIATPRMTVTDRGGIAIELMFASPDHADCVARALRNATFVHVNRERVS